MITFQDGICQRLKAPRNLPFFLLLLRNPHGSTEHRRGYVPTFNSQELINPLARCYYSTHVVSDAFSLKVIWNLTRSPVAWSITMAAYNLQAAPFVPLKYIALFGTGAFIMRSAGCTINDMWDRNLDKAVGKDSPVSGFVPVPFS